MRLRPRLKTALLTLTLPAAALVAVPAVHAAVLPPNFSDQVVFSGLTNPTAVRFAADGRVFVAQKNGVIKVFDNLADTTPTTFADLSASVHDFWDRGLLGLALHPGFPSTPYVYALYAYDARIGGTAPTWGDGCPTPPGPTTDGCLVSGRLSRLTASGNTAVSEQVLINDWCQQYPSHSIGTLLFGRDGALYVTGGDGASFNNVDYGQYGNNYAGDQVNPCGDPPGGVGTTLTSPSAQGGALRSQSVRRTPVTLDGTVLRVDPMTGQGLADNPFASSSDPNARRIVGYGLRNPFRMTQRPGTDELWIGDVGWGTWEEVDRLVPGGGRNFGWPCYEGDARQGGYEGAGLTMCSSLYSTAGSVTAPYYAYNHNACVVNYTGCRTGGSSITGIAFYNGGSYPSAYNGALFFGDHSRNEIWAMMPGANGLPDPAVRQCLVCADSSGAGAGHPVDLQIGPGGDLFYVNMDNGTIHRVVYTAANQPPTARISANPTSGDAPLTVNFSGTASTDPEGGALAYSWDLDGNGTFGDATGATTSRTYTTSGTYTASLRVTDPQGATGTASVTITVGNTPPNPIIDTPSASLRWKVGDVIPFSGRATDTQDGSVAASGLSWTLLLDHCFSTSDCHEHVVETFNGVASGQFTAPDHQYPASLRLRLTATDSQGLSTSTTVRLEPQTVQLTFKTSPGGLRLSGLGFNESTRSTPFTVTVIVGSANSVSAPETQVQNRSTYTFVSWSDGGAKEHTITAPPFNTTYTAIYRKR
ncbi:PQQ-dependent sugar dehydrogenase [Saccharothrix variisporea]|uniref:Glucose/arabinose dehydrogenase n=1 Tax=Saccharothrix variisporea TaxID=543527 RepID=A0A495XNU2_9PSEU|nr:PQQ-dependent sugar dehydrogenase [Saccharothrix variisporea]RKT74133.1 glucose/arabinose dehydrogenase [Saccharothrix variisporea]